MRAVPRGASDDERDRRFQEAAFPLLEPVGWRGERHLGGYGTEDPDHATMALGLVFGPWRPEPGEPRIELYVGRHHVIALNDVHTRVLLWNQLRRPPGTAPRMALPSEMSQVRHVAIEIAGSPIDFTVLERDAAWLAQGDWRGHAVQLEADHIVPAGLQLQPVTALPDG